MQQPLESMIKLIGANNARGNRPNFRPFVQSPNFFVQTSMWHFFPHNAILLVMLMIGIRGISIMGFNVGGLPVRGAIVEAITNDKGYVEQIVRNNIKQALNDAGGNTKKMQQPSGLSTFLDIKV
jgi:hypothetical protein